MEPSSAVPSDGGAAARIAVPGTPSQADGPETLVLFGTPVHNVTTDGALDWIVQRVREKRPGYIVTSNLDFIFQSWLDPEFHRIHVEADLVLADGMPMVWFSRLFGPALKERVPGSDLVPRLAKVARDHGHSLYCVGAGPGVARRAMDLLQERFPGLRVVGCDSPPLAPLLQMNHEEMRQNILKARPDVVLVAFGAPKQEKWIRMNLGECGVPVGIGVGGTLDFIAGVQVRAPRLLQKTGLEWLWRLLGQPRRFFKRYALNLYFLAMMMVRIFLIRMSPARRRAEKEKLDASQVESWGARITLLPRTRQASRLAAWLDQEGRKIDGRPVVVDVSEFTWLSSLELGVLVRLVAACRQAGSRVILGGASERVSRLIHLFRLHRHVDLTRSRDALKERLTRFASDLERGAVRYSRRGSRLTLELPGDFSGTAVQDARRELRRLLEMAPVDELDIEGSRLDYIDCSGARFVHELCQSAEGGRIRKKRLLRFPEEALSKMRKDGFNSGTAELS
jgi:N-acetylglucosaminyldiphosphoundecaprenol N-acetyl-beta-D-mannosaminyltransferase